MPIIACTYIWRKDYRGHTVYHIIVW
jgi:hypothetical protein